MDTNHALLPLNRMARRLHVTCTWLRVEADAGRIPCLIAGNRYLFAARGGRTHSCQARLAGGRARIIAHARPTKAKRKRPSKPLPAPLRDQSASYGLTRCTCLRSSDGEYGLAIGRFGRCDVQDCRCCNAAGRGFVLGSTLLRSYRRTTKSAASPIRGENSLHTDLQRPVASYLNWNFTPATAA